jgi:antigen flippase
VAKSIVRVGAAGRWLLRSRHGVASIAQTILTRFVLSAGNLATGVLTARTLAAGGRGEQTAMLLWPTLICYLLTLGVPSALRYCVRKEPHRRAEFFSVSVVAALCMSVVAFGVGVLLIPLWLHANPAHVVAGAQLLMIFAPIVMVGLVFVAMLEALGRFAAVNSMSTFTVVATLLSLVVLISTHRLTPFVSALTYLGPPVFTLIWAGWLLRENFRASFFDPRPALRTLGSYGIRSYGIDVLATLSTQVDQVLVVGILSAANMGVYAVALAASRVLLILHSAVVTVVFPSATGLEQERIVSMVARAARVSTATALACAFVLVIALPYLIPLMYGHDFLGAVRVAQLLTLEALIGGLVYVLAQTFMALGRPALVTLLQGIGLVVAVPAMLLLIPRFGLLGAALGLLLSTCVRFALVLLSFPTVLKISVPNLIPTFDDVRAFSRALRHD